MESVTMWAKKTVVLAIIFLASVQVFVFKYLLDEVTKQNDCGEMHDFYNDWTVPRVDPNIRVSPPSTGTPL